MFLQEVQGGVEVAHGGELAAGHRAEEVAFGEGGDAGLGQVGQDGVGGPLGGVGLHGVEDVEGVGGEVVPEQGGGGHGGGGDRPGPGVLGVGGEVEEPGDAGDGAVALAGPVHDRREAPVLAQAGLRDALVGEQNRVRLGGEGEFGGLGPTREGQGQTPEVLGVGVGGAGAEEFGGEVAVADEGFGLGVEEPGEQASPVGPLDLADGVQDVRLDGQAHGDGGVLDVLGVAGLAVDAGHVAGVALEEDAHVGDAGVASGDDLEDLALGGQDRDPSVLLGEEAGQALGRDVVGDELRLGWHDGPLRGIRQRDSLGRQIGQLVGLRVRRDLLGLLGGGLRDPRGRGGLGPLGCCQLDQSFLGGEEGLGHEGEHGAFAVAGREGDGSVEVDRLAPLPAHRHGQAPAGGGTDDGQGEAPGEVDRGLRPSRAGRPRGRPGESRAG